VVSDVVAKKLLVADPNWVRWRLRGLGNVRPRGMKEPLTAYELSPRTAVSKEDAHWMRGDYYEHQLTLWDEAVALFIGGQWAEALAQFKNNFPDDPAAKCFIRYMERTRNVPPPSWDGAFTPRPEE
jgi:hypothetical protein